MKWIMLVITLGLLTSSAYAKDVTLKWDHVTDPDLHHYTIYQADRFGDKTGPWKPVKTVEGGVNTVLLTVTDGDNFAFYATATDVAGNETQASNMVELYDRTPPGIPPGLDKIKPNP
jgi:hypothetical protein